MMFDEEEIQGLVSTIQQVSHRKEHARINSGRNAGFKLKRWGLAVLILGMAVVVLLQILRSARRDAAFNGKIIEFQCPTTLSTVNYDEEMFTEDYLTKGTQPISAKNKTVFLDTFREKEFDGWGRTFTKFKKDIHAFKKKYYVPYLKNGDKIYESACGLGLNLYLTLEILQEEANITDITVYGNEYLQQNAERANGVLDTLLEAQDTQGRPKNHRGVICHGDSTNLSHVPLASFDLVFTGFIRYVCLLWLLDNEARSPRLKKKTVCTIDSSPTHLPLR
jgi:hypothetical protein